MINGDPTQARFALDMQGLERLKQGAARDPGGQLREAANQFEGLFLHRMIQAMRDAVPRSGLTDSSQMRFYESLYDQQLSQHLAGRGVGLADQLVAQLSKYVDKADIAQGTPRALPGVSAAGAAAPSAAPARPAADAVERRAVDAPRPPLRAAANTPASAGQSAPEAFINELLTPARDAARRTGVPAPLILAQAALETGWGRHRITTEDGADSHNLFGIKAGSGWRGRTTEVTTHEYIDGQRVRRVERFRVYDSYQDAFADHGRLLTGNQRYAGVAAAADPADAARALQRGGYATDPAYADKLVRLMDQIGAMAGDERLIAAETTAPISAP
ncbi:flagellar assembly peptidoglycan hydrolase FlgJ [Alloalcanivorax gelatiniphagus]|uniref:Peptidoglycan hydrolase FlgJ n=3 Tax=Alloalcanivorax gelatiniphagus TaxID=1194167 RepID=A0ABY2XFT0_9GAMM|nr:flagellar assembly peptidoglycan hydrolase FlgJ [Alloalcanivorax gelatiniphagus]TMW10457.1 flagellar assembly peptidoglycan hydrolase FlgJ [Alloalcanivorax gelatiniphagus]|tara:strand:- start:6256 stop:7248 length:993 start_codon:yes stop_codon:yes gene_type:complete